jgi:exopolysaccharide production protein ExoY
MGLVPTAFAPAPRRAPAGPPLRARGEVPRRILDFVSAGAFLVLTLPLLLVGALAVLLASGRPVFYGHLRVGRWGRPFKCWKLRTMERGAERRLKEDPDLHRRYVESGYKLPLDADPRITPVGGWLRRTYLDELPQLVNVLSGSMSFIGPRPVVPEELEEFGEDAGELLSVRPGIFGAWNSLGRERPGYPERARIELEYVRNQGTWLDLRVLLRSVPTVLKGAGEVNGSGTRREPAEKSQDRTSLESSSVPSQGPAPEAEGLRRILLNARSLLFAYLLPRLATFAAAVVAARVLGAAEFGAYGAAAALAVILSIVSTLGMMQLLIRDLAQAPGDAPRLMGAANAAKTGSNLVMLGALAVLAIGVLRYPPEVVAATLLLGVSYAIGSYGENLGAYFQSVERMEIWMQAQAILGVVTGALGVVLVVGTRSMVWFCAAPVVGQMGAVAWLLLRAPPSVRTARGASWPEIRRLLDSLLPFAAAFVVLTAYYKVDILLVEGWRGSGEAGLYAAAYKFVDVGQALALVFATAVYPRLARMATPAAMATPASVATPATPGAGITPDGHVPPYSWASTRAVELLVLGGIPAAGLLWLLREPLVWVLFGEEFIASAPVLGFLAPVIPVLALNVLGTFILAAAGRMGAVAGLYASGLVLNLGLNALMIPVLGARGAALAMLVSEAVLAVGMLAVLHRHTATVPNRRTRTAAVAAAFAVALVAWPGASSLAEAAAYLLAVTLLYWLGRVVTPRELSLLRRAIHA